MALYISLIVGFFLNENLNLGAKPDWYFSDIPVIEAFSIDFKKTFFNYDFYGHRHSPVYLIFLSRLSHFKYIVHMQCTVSMVNYNVIEQRKKMNR